MNPSFDFHDQIALVTGAASGIGLATSLAFAEAGATVILADVNEEKVRREASNLVAEGYSAVGVECDVREETQVKALMDGAVDAFGRIDIAFNNAGILGYTGDVADEPLETYDEVAEINLRGVWACMKHELRFMRAQGHGCIVNMSSLGGLVGQENRATYHAAKHGVIGLTKSVAMDYARHGIRINAVCPGVIATAMSAGLTATHGDFVSDVLREQPIGRLGRPEEVAAAVLWLASPGASFVIGVALPVDGGFVAH
ncbi:MAG: Oxidoreductase [Aeromicrobium sp.]|nr:Oxidoreductase [Aeromicrobium sp.]